MIGSPESKQTREGAPSRSIAAVGADWPLLGNYFPRARFLRELRALFAEGLASGIRHTMFRLDAFPIWAIVVVVVHFPVFGRIFR